MKKVNKFFIKAILIIVFSCDSNTSENQNQEKEHTEAIELTNEQYNSLNIKIGKIEKKEMYEYVDANGHIDVFPEDRANVSSFIGGNIVSIKIKEGDKVNKGDIIAQISHSDIIKLQTNYIKTYNDNVFKEKEYNRVKELFMEKIASKTEYEKQESEYNSLKGLLKGMEAELRLINLDYTKIREGHIYDKVNIISPINGYIDRINARIGEYVSSNNIFANIVNIEKAHADLLLFEKDMYKIKIGQEVIFNVQSYPLEKFYGEITNIGKTFEQNTHSLHTHSKINNKPNYLIPGMYIKGKIIVDKKECFCVPENSIVLEENKNYIFSIKKHGEKWEFLKVEIERGISDFGFVEIRLKDTSILKDTIVYDGTYYIMAQMKKGEMEASH